MTTRSEFNDKTTSEEVASAFAKQINGRNVVLTGVSPSGIGSATAMAIASQSPNILILASRTQKNLDVVVADIKAKYPATVTKTVILDLSSVESTKAAGEAVNALVEKVDVLINNAGITQPNRVKLATPNGTFLDQQLFTNHIGTFLFTSILLPKLVAAAKDAPEGSTRIVNLSSHGHRLSPIRFSDYAFEKDTYEGVPEDERPATNIPDMFKTTVDGYPGFMAYGQSKTANVLHALELSRRLRVQNTGVLALALHPGTINTDLSRSLDAEGQKTINGTAPLGLWKTLSEGAATSLVAAFDPALSGAKCWEAEGTCGYLADCQPCPEKLAPHAINESTAAKLWAETEKMLGVTCL